MSKHEEKEKEPVYKNVWFWILIVVLVICFIAIVGNKNTTPTGTTTSNTVTTPTKQEKITLEKFNKIQTGMTYEEVVEIIGEEGTVNSESNITNDEKYHTIFYSWKAADGIANANVTFQGGKVVSKAQFGLK